MSSSPVTYWYSEAFALLLVLALWEDPIVIQVCGNLGQQVMICILACTMDKNVNFSTRNVLTLLIQVVLPDQPNR